LKTVSVAEDVGSCFERALDAEAYAVVNGELAGAWAEGIPAAAWEKDGLEEGPQSLAAEESCLDVTVELPSWTTAFGADLCLVWVLMAVQGVLC